MIRHRDGGTRRDGAPGLPDSVPEIARILRRVRTRQGLRLEDISVRAALPLAQLEALESGSVDRLPDRVTTVKTLRGYAGFLGLSGDQFALALVECWPTGPSIHPTGPPGLPTGQVAVRPPAAAVQGTPGVVPTSGTPTSMFPSVAATTGPPTGPITVVPVATTTNGPWPQVTQFPTVPPVPGVADTGVTPRIVGPPTVPEDIGRAPPSGSRGWSDWSGWRSSWAWPAW